VTKLCAVVCLILLSSRALAAPCDRLSPAQKKTAQELFRSTYPYACCDESLDRCLKQRKVCKLAKRLRDAICRRVLKGQNAAAIRSALDRRARSMMPTKPVAIDLGQAPRAGAADAPVTVVAYACARCPFCSKVVPQLHQLVTDGGLKGRVKLHFRTFPIRSHPGSVEGGLAFVAAIRLGKFWPYLLKLYREYDSFAEDKLVPWAEAVGMARGAFVKEMRSASARAFLVGCKKEGLRNGVKATPTLFINGRKYHGDLDRETLVDVLDEEADRVGERQFCGN